MCGNGDGATVGGQTARMNTRPPRPPRGIKIAMDSRCENLRVPQGFNGFWRTPALGAQIQVHDGTGSRITLTRALGVGILAGAMRKPTGHVTVVVIGRDGQTKMIKAKAGKAQALLTWEFEFTAWNEAQHRMMNLPYPPLMAPPQA